MSTSTKPVRVRVAPSPTGDPHVGTAYMALFNHAFARQQGGKFLLRIEDTDQTRSTRASEEAILSSLAWLGLDWDEGPDKGGPFGPYRQSERVAIHQEHAAILRAKGAAYRCFCTPERLDDMRKLQVAAGRPPGYDRKCRAVDSDEAERRVAGGEPAVLRLKVPTTGVCEIRDLLHGEVKKDWASIDDQVLLKSDGFPTYHLANVVDDHLMEISHVIRGEEWLNSVPKHLKLYEYFGWEPPIFCHLPLLRNNDKNKTKLSKRKNPTSIGFYRRAGYLPQALVNFLGLMGFSMPGGEEKFSLAQMIEHFRLEDLSTGGPVFDTDKLRWLNGRYLREDMPPEALLGELKRWALDDDRLRKIVPLAQPRMETMGDWGYLTAFLFAEHVPVAASELTLKGKTQDELLALFQITVWEMEKLRNFDAQEVKTLFAALSEKTGVKLRDLTRPYYVAVCGSPTSLPLFDAMALLESDITRMRVRRAIDVLGGLSGAKLKAVEQQHQEWFGGVQD